jgi:hypothetical protein
LPIYKNLSPFTSPAPAKGCKLKFLINICLWKKYASQLVTNSLWTFVSKRKLSSDLWQTELKNKSITRLNTPDIVADTIYLLLIKKATLGTVTKKEEDAGKMDKWSIPERHSSTHPVAMKPQLFMVKFHLFLPRSEVDCVFLFANNLGYHSNPPSIVAKGINLIEQLEPIAHRDRWRTGSDVPCFYSFCQRWGLIVVLQSSILHNIEAD